MSDLKREQAKVKVNWLGVNLKHFGERRTWLEVILKPQENWSILSQHAWLMDDDFFVESKEDALMFWETVKTNGPDFGYIFNERSKIYDLDSSNIIFWESAGLTYIQKTFSQITI